MTARHVVCRSTSSSLSAANSGMTSAAGSPLQSYKFDLVILSTAGVVLDEYRLRPLFLSATVSNDDVGPRVSVVDSQRDVEESRFMDFMDASFHAEREKQS